MTSGVGGGAPPPQDAPISAEQAEAMEAVTTVAETMTETVNKIKDSMTKSSGKSDGEKAGPRNDPNLSEPRKKTMFSGGAQAAVKVQLFENAAKSDELALEEQAATFEQSRDQFDVTAIAAEIEAAAEKAVAIATGIQAGVQLLGTSFTAVGAARTVKSTPKTNAGGSAGVEGAPKGPQSQGQTGAGSGADGVNPSTGTKPGEAANASSTTEIQAKPSGKTNAPEAGQKADGTDGANTETAAQGANKENVPDGAPAQGADGKPAGAGDNTNPKPNAVKDELDMSMRQSMRLSSTKAVGDGVTTIGSIQKAVVEAESAEKKEQAKKVGGLADLIRQATEQAKEGERAADKSTDRAYDLLRSVDQTTNQASRA